MKNIEIFEKTIQDGGNLQERGINATLYWAYRNTQDSGNDLINFDEVIWDNDIQPICNTLKENNITEFTISSTFSSLIATLAQFDAQGFKMDGIVRVKSRHANWSTGERELIPAIKMVRA